MKILGYKRDYINTDNLKKAKVRLNYVLMKIVTNIVVMILNFVFSKIFIFKKGNSKNEEKNA